jgi:hypothetical protein
VGCGGGLARCWVLRERALRLGWSGLSRAAWSVEPLGLVLLVSPSLLPLGGGVVVLVVGSGRRRVCRWCSARSLRTA